MPPGGIRPQAFPSGPPPNGERKSVAPVIAEIKPKQTAEQPIKKTEPEKEKAKPEEIKTSNQSKKEEIKEVPTAAK
jgi:hypothetical protein